MKPTILLLSLAVMLPALGQTTAVYTTPSGYVKHSIDTGFNYIGLTVHQPILVSGTLGTPNGTSLPSSVADLSSALGAADANSLMIIEITGGDNEGVMIESNSWSGGDFTSIANLTDYSNLEGDPFQIRSAVSISDLFGATNTAGLTEGTIFTADVIWVSAGGGNFNKYFYSPGDPNAFPVPVAEGWKDALGNDSSNVKINYCDGLFIQRLGASTQITFFGEVKTEKTNLALEGNGFNFFGGVYPASITLEHSNLQNFITHGSISTGDIIWMPDGASSWKVFYYADANPNAFPVPVTAGWKDSLGADASDTDITSGLIIQRLSATPVNALYQPDLSVYNSL